MRKTTVLHYNEADVRKIVHDELVKTKPAWTSEITEKVTEKITQFKDDVIAMLDKVMGELKAIREEQTLMSGWLSTHTDTLEDHEARIGKLEKRVNPPPST